MKKLSLTLATALIAGILGFTAPADANRPMHTVRHEPCGMKKTHTLFCVWDAKHRGNGKGRSFVILPRGPGTPIFLVMYISHRKAHRLLG